MESPAFPENEVARLQALKELEILDTSAEEKFDRLTRLAKQIFQVDFALISLIDANRQWFKSRQGLDACETNRDISFCGHAILGNEIFHIPNALNDPRFADNPLVLGPPNIRFYAGAPLRPNAEFCIGTLCIIDSQPRTLSIKEMRILRDLADCVEQEILQLQQLRQNQALQALAKISTIVDPDYANLLRHALNIASQFINLEDAAIYEFGPDLYEAELTVYTSESDTNAKSNLCLQLSKLAVTKQSLLVIPSIRQSPYVSLDSGGSLPFDSFIGIPIVINGAVYGCLAFFDQDTRPPNHLNKATLDFIQLLSEWTASKLYEWELDTSLKRQRQLALAISRAQENFIHGDNLILGFQTLLQDLLALSHCEFGFIAEALKTKSNEDYLKTIAYNKPRAAFSQATLENEDIHADLIAHQDQQFFWSSIFDQAIRVYEESQIVVSDLHFIWPSLASCQHFLSIPIHYNGQLVAIIGLANRPHGFCEKFIQFLKPIMLTIGQLIHAARVQSQHADSERQLADVIRGTNIGTWEWNVQTGEVRFNERWANIIGYTLQEISPVDIQTWIKFVHPEDLIQSNLLLQKHFDGELDYYDIVCRMRHKDGHWVWVADRGCLVSRTKDGQPLLMSGSHADISRSKEAESQLAHAYALLEQSNAAAQIGTWEVDFQHSLVTWSSITKEIHEVPTDFVCTVDEAIQFYKEGKDRQLVSQLVQEAIQNGSPFDTELRIVTMKQRERWVRIVGTCQFNGAECERMYGTVQDISERKHAEKMKDEFISTVSHELRTPLTSISGALGLVVGGVVGELPSKIAGMLQIAHKNSQRLSLLINDLLDMEKLSAGQLQIKAERLLLGPIVETAVEGNIAAGIERMISNAIKDTAPNTYVMVDPQRLLQILSNLLSNATKYSPNHGHIQIQITRIENWVRVSVTDQGPGIPLEFQSRIFQKFAQADSSDTRQRGGTGLGLAISKELVESMHGKLHFESLLGHGTSFYVDLPVSEAET
ncbi:ATP-binding protein [Undibacterium fentianense]|uniref:histidine kinase n=1 Tax=Undibacterium fentianense TaxID=2828728 RepID=A0A941E2P4_9BURK|nr:ATP-binding protein [Undibacterium fentianense]MBR7801230.1 PAS domain-containing protein [Undibacterium fentianense]